MPQLPLAFQLLAQDRAGARELGRLGHEREHDLERPARARAQKRLQLHPQDPALVEAKPDRAPPHRRVRLVLRLHVRQDLVGPDVEGAEHDGLALRVVHHLAVQRGEIAAPGHAGSGQELQLGAEQAHAFGPRPFERGQVGHQARVHVKLDPGAAGGDGGQAAQVGVSFLRLGLHRDLVAERGGHAVLGAQVDDPGVAVDENRVAVQRLDCDPARVDDQRDRQRPRDDGRVAADAAFGQDHPAQLAAIVQQFGRADVARDEDRVFRHLGPGVAALPGQDPQQPVRQVVKIVQPLAQIGVGRAFQPRAGLPLFLFHRSLGRQAKVDVLFHPPHPAARVGEHAEGFHDVGVVAAAQRQVRQQRIEPGPQHRHALGQARTLALRIVADRVRHDDAGFVQPDMPLGRAFLPAGAPEHGRKAVARGHAVVAAAGKGAQFRHLGQHHRNDFHAVAFVLGEAAGLARLHDQNAQLLAHALDRHAQERGIHLFPRLGHEAEARLGGRVGGVDRLAGAGHAAHQPLAQPQPGLMHRLGAQPFGRAQFQRLRIAEQIDRTDLGPDRIGDVVGDVVEPVLARPRRGKRVPEPLKQLAGFAFGQVSAQLSVPRRAAWPPAMADPGDQALSSWKASCSACTASSIYLRSIRTEILISLVAITLMLMFSSASALNMRAATPACERIPIPTTDTLATSSSTTSSS